MGRKEGERTPAEICEAYVKWKGLSMTGRQFWELDPRGELFHVFAARLEMEAAGHEIPILSNPFLRSGDEI